MVISSRAFVNPVGHEIKLVNMDAVRIELRRTGAQRVGKVCGGLAAFAAQMTPKDMQDHRHAYADRAGDMAKEFRVANGLELR